MGLPAASPVTAPPAGDPAPPAGPPLRRLIAAVAAAAVLSFLFVLSFGYAQHAPRPHGVDVDVVGPVGAVARISTALAAEVPGAFDVSAVPDEAIARRHLHRRDSDAALILAGAGPVRLLTAGRPVVAVDVVPLPAGDRSGLAVFALDLGLLVPAVLAAIGVFVLGRRRRPAVRLAAVAGYVVAAAALAVLALDAGLGALTGHPWTLFGDGLLVAGAFALTVVALHCLFGLAGTLLAVGALMVVGNAVNGVAVPTAMLPDGYRQIAPWLPNNAGADLVRSHQYFGGHGQGGPLLTLIVWLAVAALLIVAADMRHVRRRGRR